MSEGNRPIHMRPVTQTEIEEAQRNAMALALVAYIAIRGAEFAFDRLAAGARFVRKGMESAARTMAENYHQGKNGRVLLNGPR